MSNYYFKRACLVLLFLWGYTSLSHAQIAKASPTPIQQDDRTSRIEKNEETKIIEGQTKATNQKKSEQSVEGITLLIYFVSGLGWLLISASILMLWWVSKKN